MDRNVRVPNESLKHLALKEEPRFLSLILKSKDKFIDTYDFGIKPGSDGHFWCKDANLLYSIAYEYFKKYGTLLTRTGLDSIVDTIMLGGKKVQEEHKTSVRVYWDKICAINVSDEDYPMLKDHINERYVQWQAYEFYKKNLTGIVGATRGQIELVKEAKNELLAIDGLEPDNYSKTLSMIEALDEVESYIAERRATKEDLQRVPTYIKGIDKVFNGFEKGSYTVVAGLINGGKTTLMMNIGFQMALKGHHVVYVSLEKKALLLFIRLVCLYAEVDYNRLKIGGSDSDGIDDYHYDKLLDAVRELRGIVPNFHCIQKPQGTSLSNILSDVNRIEAKNPIDVLIVDYLGVIGNETVHVGRSDLDDWKTSSRLQAFGKIKNYVTITGSQLKTQSAKEVRNKAKKAATADVDVDISPEDLAGSKMIIGDADNGLGCALNYDSPPTKMYVYSMKARDDASRVQIELDFDGRLGRVCDPQFAVGQVTNVDDIVYNDEITEAELNEISIFDSKEPDLLSNVGENKQEDVDIIKKNDIIDSQPQESSIPKEKDDIFGDLF